MSTFSVAEAKNTLPRLIDRAMDGEEVVITRHGKPVAELRPVVPKPPGRRQGSLEWLLAQTRGPPSGGITSVELLNLMYEGEGE